MRHQHARRAIIERSEDAADVRNADEPGDAAGAGAHQRLVRGEPVEGRMLLIDHDEVEADAAQHLGRVACRELDEGAEELLLRQEALAEAGRGLLGHRRRFPVAHIQTLGSHSVTAGTKATSASRARQM